MPGLGSRVVLHAMFCVQYGTKKEFHARYGKLIAAANSADRRPQDIRDGEEASVSTGEQARAARARWSPSPADLVNTLRVVRSTSCSSNCVTTSCVAPKPSAPRNCRRSGRSSCTVS